ncbi:MAG: IS1595 family transposase, partial [Draconibacterium sp.]
MCPRCKSEEHWLTGKRLIHCKSCGHQSSVTAGTI